MIRQALADARRGDALAREFLEICAPDVIGENMSECKQLDLVAQPTPGSMTAFRQVLPPAVAQADLPVKMLEYSQPPAPKPPRPVELQPLPPVDELAKLLEDEPSLHRLAWAHNFDQDELWRTIQRSPMLREIGYRA